MAAVPDPGVQSEQTFPGRPKLLAAAVTTVGLALAATAFIGKGVPDTTAPAAVVSTSATPVPVVVATEPALLEIAEAYFAHWDAGEVAAYEALVSPDANLFTQGAAGEVAIESWYRIATGVELERHCGVAGPNQVRCETTLVSGLQPGVVIADSKPVVLSIREGVIVDFQFPRGFQTVYEDDFVGLNAYREWMAENAPQDFKQLFLFPKTIVVNSEDARTRHQEMVAEFLESAIAAS